MNSPEWKWFEQIFNRLEKALAVIVFCFFFFEKLELRTQWKLSRKHNKKKKEKKKNHKYLMKSMNKRKKITISVYRKLCAIFVLVVFGMAFMFFVCWLRKLSTQLAQPKRITMLKCCSHCLSLGITWIILILYGK